MITLEFPEPRLSSTPIRGRILLAEDGTHNQWMVSYFLQEAGAEVTLAGNGQIACTKAIAAMAAGAPFDAILMDMQMPVMDGYAATSAIRAAGYRGPIIAVTADATPDQRERCRKSGCSSHIPKPIDREVLIQTIAAVLFGDEIRTSPKLRDLAPAIW